MMTSASTAVLDAARAQAQLARGLWADRRFRAPILTIWVATFGSSLHGPVTTYFYLRVGASARDVGALNAIITGVAVGVAGVYLNSNLISNLNPKTRF